MEKKAIADEEKNDTGDAAEKAANTGALGRLFVRVGQRVGIIEWTKLEPRFESNINKLISYHNIIYNIVDGIEMQVQLDPRLLQERKVLSPEGENPWEMIGGWLHYMSLTQFEGQQTTILQKYSYACGKIAQKEVQMQKRTRSHLIKKMRLYTGDGSAELNEGVVQLANFLQAIDKARHYMKSAPTTKDLKIRGEEYRKWIRAFNEKAFEVQGWIDEVTTQVTLHQNEFLKFSHELSLLHDSTHNTLTETLYRLGYRVAKK